MGSSFCSCGACLLGLGNTNSAKCFSSFAASLLGAASITDKPRAALSAYTTRWISEPPSTGVSGNCSSAFITSRPIAVFAITRLIMKAARKPSLKTRASRTSLKSYRRRPKHRKARAGRGSEPGRSP